MPRCYFPAVWNNGIYGSATSANISPISKLPRWQSFVLLLALSEWFASDIRGHPLTNTHHGSISSDFHESRAAFTGCLLQISTFVQRFYFIQSVKSIARHQRQETNDDFVVVCDGKRSDEPSDIFNQNSECNPWLHIYSWLRFGVDPILDDDYKTPEPTDKHRL